MVTSTLTFDLGAYGDDTCLDVEVFWSVTFYVPETWNENVFLVIWNVTFYVVEF